MKKISLRSKKITPSSSPALTSNDDELEFREKRGQNEEMFIEPLQKQHSPFVAYSVQGQTGINYIVELRSLTNKINSCSCPDFQINTLGTCKHIEGVFHYLKQNKMDVIAKESPHIEIYLAHSENPKVSIAWPKESSLNPKFKNMLEAFFSANNTLIADPVRGMASIHHTLFMAPPELQKKIRISSHLTSWVSNLREKEGSQLSKDQFLKDVSLGKRSLQMLNVPLYPYQEEGMLHLAFKERAILGDEMGLGKTIQAIAASELLRRTQNIRRVLVISPASLKGEWEEQIAAFTGLPTLIVKGTRAERLELYKKEAFFFLANYEQIRSDFAEIQAILSPDVVILDEAQRIKNWQTKTAWAVKQLKTPYAFVLSGTPIENRIDEIYSIMQMVDPFVLGPLFKFHQNFYAFDAKGKPSGYKNLEQLHQKLKPVLLRRLKKNVEEQLPERTVNNFFVKMEEEQAIRYEEYNLRVARLLQITKKRPLNSEESKLLQQYLACMRMLCDTPYILDENCRICPKLDELKQLLTEMLQGNENKIIIFSEWERMLSLVREFVEKELKADFAWHTGTVPQTKRLEDIKKFKQDPNCRLFLTTDSGSMGLNLQCANIVINLDLPWNPAKLEQRIARAWRKNQTRAVQVINLICEDSIEHRMLSLLKKKQALADGILDGMGDLENMSLSSPRTEILNELQSILLNSEQTEETREIPPCNPLENIANDAISHFGDRIHQMEMHQDPSTGQKTILGIIDKLDAKIESKMQEFVQTNQEEPVRLELLDQHTHALLRRLAEAGMITIHPEAGKTLYRSPNLTLQQQTEKEKRLKEARTALHEAERQLKMMNLLDSGGFSMEAMTPGKNALTLGLKGNKILGNGPDAEGALLLERIEAWFEHSDAKQAKSLMESIKQALQDYSVKLTRYELSCA